MSNKTKAELEAEIAALKAQLEEKDAVLNAASGDPLVRNPSRQTITMRLGGESLVFPPGESRLDPDQYFRIMDDDATADVFNGAVARGVIELRAAI